jgi:hypothetical protein
MTWRIWTQYRPNHERRDLKPALEARLYDPLWLLARQFQIGEFFGEDAGSPVKVEVESDAFVADRCRIGEQNLLFDPANAPLEALVEREPDVAPDLRARAQWGLLFAARLEASALAVDRSALAGQFPIAQDEAASAALDAAARLIVAKAPDAEGLKTHFGSDPTADAEILAVFPGAHADRLDAYRSAIDGWLADYRRSAMGPVTESAWSDDRFEYSFEVSVPTDVGRIVLRAPEYHGGRLDWDAFDVEAIAPPDSDPASGQRQSLKLLPAQIGYFGMPAPRFWEFEDAAVDFGDPGGGERDVGRMLLAEIAMAWGNDWFQIPVDAPAGSLVRINKLLVTDTFGVTTLIPSQRLHSPAWAVNRLSHRDGLDVAGDFLWVAPVLPVALESRPVEEILLKRDEMANLAWAIEAIVPNQMGRPIDLQAEGTSRPHGLGRLRLSGQLEYRVIPDLPENWMPMVPVRGAGNERFLALAGLLDEEGVEPALPRGALLTGSAPLRLHEAELTRAGFIAARHWQVARLYDGRRIAWIGRRRRPGVGELRSELEFDTLIGSFAQGWPAQQVEEPLASGMFDTSHYDSGDHFTGA